jgi:ABC-type nitrate/sulfonate/bicarbonate transport system permease component
MAKLAIAPTPRIVRPPTVAAAAPRPVPSAPGRRRGPGWSSPLGFLAAWLILGGVWEIGARVGFLNPAILPPPTQFIPYLIQGAGTVGIGVNRVSYGQAVLETLLRVAIGFGLGIGGALVVGTLLASIAPARLVGLPIAQTIAPIAPVAWIPLAIVLFGTGNRSAIFIVFMGIFATMTLATVAALSAVPPEYIKGARCLGSRGWRLWLRVIIPAAAPSLATAIRISFFAAWMSVLAGEMAGIDSGLGALVILGQQEFQMKLVMAGLVTIGVLGFGFDRLLLLLRHRVLWWEARHA